MNNLKRNTVLIILFAITAFSLSACSTLDRLSSSLNNKKSVDYQNNKSIKNLEIPPDLTAPEFDNAFDLPKGVVSLKTGKVISQANTPTAVAPKVKLSSVIKSGERDVLKINTKYSKALVLTETMLTRMGFSTISKSPSGNVITAIYNGEDVITADSSVLNVFTKFRIRLGKNGRVVNRSLLKGETYVITIYSEKGSPIVRFAKAKGASLSNAQHAKIISLLNSTFNN